MAIEKPIEASRVTVSLVDGEMTVDLVSAVGEVVATAKVPDAAAALPFARSVVDITGAMMIEDASDAAIARQRLAEMKDEGHAG